MDDRIHNKTDWWKEEEEREKYQTSLNLDEVNTSRTDEVKKVKGKRFVWTNTNEYIFFICVWLFDAGFLHTFLHGQLDRSDQPSIFHYFIVTTVFGLPMLYMQIFMGQYCQFSVLHLGKLAPIIEGLGCSVLLMVFHQIFARIEFLSIIMQFIVNSFTTELPWMIYCPPDTECLNYSTMKYCKDNCSNFTVSDFSVALYWTHKAGHGGTVTGYGYLNWTSLFYAAIIMLFVAWPVIKGIRTYKQILRINFYFTIVLLTIMILVLLNVGGIRKGIIKYFAWDPATIISISAWSHSFVDVCNIFNMCHAAHMLFGSYLPLTVHSDILSIKIACVIFIAGTVMACISTTIVEILNDILHWRNPKWVGAQLYVCIVPQVLGYLPLSSIVTASFYILIFLLDYNSLVVGIDAIAESIIDYIPTIQMYRTYMVWFICGGAFVLSMPAFLSGGITYLTGSVYPLTYSTIFFVQVITVMYLYGFQRFSDDVHFQLDFQPALFWKLCWIISPACIGLVIKVSSHSLPNIETIFEDINVLFAIVPMVTLTIGAIYQIFQHLKQHNLMGLIKPQPTWGPRDPKERQLRQMFNPREEIRSRRRVEICKHSCLTNSNVLRTIVQKERERIKKYEEAVAQAYEEEAMAKVKTQQLKELSGEIADDVTKSIIDEAVSRSIETKEKGETKS